MEAIVLSTSEPLEKPKNKAVDHQWQTSPKIKAEELTFEGEIGRGYFSVVSKGKCRGIPVAIKKLDASDASQLSLLLDEFQRELEALHKMRHPNILQFLGTEQTSMSLVFELMSFSVNDLLYDNAPNMTSKLVHQTLQRVRSTSLTTSAPLPTSSVEDLSKLTTEKLTFKKEKLSMHHKMKILLGTASACAWLHGSKPPIIHGQLKPSNILLDSHWNIKIADFEIGPQIRALRRTKESFEFEQTFVWTAPEVLGSSGVTDKSDVYSFAICAWEILHEEKPFDGLFSDMKEFVDAVVDQELRPSISSRVPTKLKELIEWCWHSNPTSRPSFLQIIPILEGALVDCHIDDPQGANFWKQYFLGKEEILWSEFYDKIAHFLGLKVSHESLDINGKCLKKMICDDNEMVNCERFGFVVNAFGPLVVNHKGFSILDKVRAAMAAEWFHGDISREISENLLSNQKPGTFLVRISATDKTQPFTISRVNSKSGIDHCRIQKISEGRLRANLKREGQEKEFVTNKSSIAMMVKLIAKELNLKTPCPGYPYKGVFSQTDSEGYLLDDE